MKKALFSFVRIPGLFRAINGLLLFSVCGMMMLAAKTPSVGAEAEPIKEDVAVRAVNDLALDLYRVLSGGGENLCFSPYSISSAFAMTYAGARGETAAEMKEALHYGEDIHESNRILKMSVSGAPESAGELAIANSIWPMRGYRFLNAYKNLLRRDYDVEVTPLDYKRQPERSRRAVNEWVEEKTRERIKDILPPNSVGVDTRLVLVNAVYFKAPWIEAFKDFNTADADFFVTSADRRSVRMMNAVDTYHYMDRNDFQAVKMLYKQGAYSMTLILPKQRSGMPAFESALTPELLKEIQTMSERRRLDLYVPKFKAERTFDVSETMQFLGIRQAFDPTRADFSGMNGKRDLYISAAIHKAFVEIDEEGTEAAAATAISVSRMSAPINVPEPLVFRADHPFIFMIQDEASGTILFMGKVVKP